MDFNFPRNTKTVKEIYDAFKEDLLIIDNSYQRRKVWLLQDKIRLIETVLLNLIVPEIFLWECDIDPDTGKTVRHIVDGQQRINAIIDFISGEFKLNSKYLLDQNVVEKYGNCLFKDLPGEVKKLIWGYDLSIVNIDKRCSEKDIKNLFFRLNLTDYSLNEQEKRNSLSSEFGNVSEQLANNPFWEEHKVFSAADIRRMKDVEFCSNILILAREGIIDQTSQQKLNQIYDDLKENYVDKEEDIARVESAMSLIDMLTNEETASFIAKKAQIYSVFSFVLDLVDNQKELTPEMINKFTAFVSTYNSFKNEKELVFEKEPLMQAYENIKRYKLASSEGINKAANRMIRFEIIKRICVSSDDNMVHYLKEVKEEILKVE